MYLSPVGGRLCFSLGGVWETQGPGAVSFILFSASGPSIPTQAPELSGFPLTFPSAMRPLGLLLPGEASGVTPSPVIGKEGPSLTSPTPAVPG